MPDIDLNAEPYRTAALLGVLTGRLRREGWPLVDQLDALIDGLLERVEQMEVANKELEHELNQCRVRLTRQHARAEGYR